MRTARHSLLTSFLLLTAAGCRDSGTGTDPVDLSVPADLSVAEDLAGPPVDLSRSGDMAAKEPVEFMVVRVGDGAAALNNTATAVFIDRHRISDGMRVGTPIALPTMAAGLNKRLTLSGTSVSEGGLTRSTNASYLVMAGYDAMLGTTNLTSSASGTVNRVIARIAADNTVDTSTAFDGLGGASPRGAASTDGNMLWASGGNGIVYTTRGSTAAPISLSTANLRGLGIFDGQLYVSGGAGGIIGIGRVGNGTPTTAGAMVTALPGFSSTMPLSPYGFAAFDRDATPGIDTIYIADDRTTGGGVHRYRLSGGTWMNEGTFSASATTGARAVAAYVGTSGVVIVAVITEAGMSTAKVVSFVDTGQMPSTAMARDLVSAPTNTSYRGLSFAPDA